MRSANTLVLGLLLAAWSPCAHPQANPAAPASKPAPAAAGKAAPQNAKPAAQGAKPAAQDAKPAATKTAAKPATKPAAKPAAKSAGKKTPKPSVAPQGAGAPEEGEAKLTRRDPFESLVARQKALADAGKNLPPGKAGLQVSTLRLDGVVRAPNGMIAVVTNPQLRTYFLHEGDKLFDGEVEKISMDGVSFHEEGKDAFGKPVERQVNKKIYSTSAGEQQ
jgi:hypothetical protein